MVKDKNSTTITIRLPKTQKELLKKIASENKVSVTELIKSSIERYGIQNKRQDIEELEEHLKTVVKVQRNIAEGINVLSQFNEHLIWDKADSHTVKIDGKNVQCFPLYWIRAIKRS